MIQKVKLLILLITFYSLLFIKYCFADGFKKIWSIRKEIYFSNESLEPIILRDNIIFITKRDNPKSLKSWLKDEYQLNILRIKDGKKIFKKVIKYNDEFLQIRSIKKWKENIVLFSYYNTKPGVKNRICLLLKVDSDFNVSKLIDFKWKSLIFCIDKKNNYLVILENKFIILFDLLSLKEVSKVNVGKLVYSIQSDKNGNIIVGRRGDEWNEVISFKTITSSGYIEKYRIKPWKKEWSLKLLPDKGFPNLISCNDNIIKYTIYLEDNSLEPKDRDIWSQNIVSSITGKIEKTNDFYNKSGIIINIKGDTYKIDYTENCIIMYKKHEE